MSEDLTGSRLGHYKIEGVLGRGGMSVMYRASDVRLGRKVALKVMGEHITGDTEFRERFVDEARNTSAIDHANIVPLYDFGEVDGMLYIAMRLVDGADLAKLISEGPISPQRALELLTQVAEALDMLHEQGLVHLDLKPANVLVTSREAAHEHVYLADFGLTRRGATGHRTSTGDFLGSPTYAAPEHLRGEPVDGRTDLYALACMLFACLTGRPPFKGDVQEVIQGHLRLDAPAVTSRVVLPAAIDEVLRCGMAKYPDQRYATCRELVAAARQALSSVAQPGSPAPRASSPDAGVSGPQQVPGGFGPASPARPPTGPAMQGSPAPNQSPLPPTPPPGMQQPGGYPPRPQDPVRLRPPMPAQSAPFARRSGGSARWVVPMVVAVGIVAIVVIFTIMITTIGSGGDSGSGATYDTDPTYGSSGEISYDHNDSDLPTSVPTVGG